MSAGMRILLVVGVIAAVAGMSNLIFVVSRLPDVHWSSLLGGVCGLAVAAIVWTLYRWQRRINSAKHTSL